MGETGDGVDGSRGWHTLLGALGQQRPVAAVGLAAQLDG